MNGRQTSIRKDDFFAAVAIALALINNAHGLGTYVHRGQSFSDLVCCLRQVVVDKKVHVGSSVRTEARNSNRPLLLELTYYSSFWILN